MPASRTASRATITVSVRRAFATAGGANALTPLLTASTPVIAVQPLANERSSNHTLAAATPAGRAPGATTGVGWPPAVTALAVPIARTAISVPTKRYVGTANTTPDSRTPRRLTNVMITSVIRQRASVCACSPVSADTNAPTPAEIPTATFRT